MSIFKRFAPKNINLFLFAFHKVQASLTNNGLMKKSLVNDKFLIEL